MRFPSVPLTPREKAFTLAHICRRVVATARNRDQFEDGLAYAVRVTCLSEASAERFLPQVEMWYLKEQWRRTARTIEMFKQLRARHRMPQKLKPRRAFKRATH